MGIMFLMYAALLRTLSNVHKKNPGRSRKGQHKTDQGFYRHGCTTRDPAQRTIGKSEESKLLEGVL
jgi:hypothetical protein